MPCALRADVGLTLALFARCFQVTWLYSYILATYSKLDSFSGPQLSRVFELLPRLAPYGSWLDEIIQICAAESARRSAAPYAVAEAAAEEQQQLAGAQTLCTLLRARQQQRRRRRAGSGSERRRLAAAAGGAALVAAEAAVAAGAAPPRARGPGAVLVEQGGGVPLLRPVLPAAPQATPGRAVGSAGPAEPLQRWPAAAAVPGRGPSPQTPLPPPSSLSLGSTYLPLPQQLPVGAGEVRLVPGPSVPILPVFSAADAAFRPASGQVPARGDARARSDEAEELLAGAAAQGVEVPAAALTTALRAARAGRGGGGGGPGRGDGDDDDPPDDDPMTMTRLTGAGRAVAAEEEAAALAALPRARDAAGVAVLAAAVRASPRLAAVAAAVDLGSLDPIWVPPPPPASPPPSPPERLLSRPRPSRRASALAAAAVVAAGARSPALTAIPVPGSPAASLDQGGDAPLPPAGPRTTPSARRGGWAGSGEAARPASVPAALATAGGPEAGGLLAAAGGDAAEAAGLAALGSAEDPRVQWLDSSTLSRLMGQPEGPPGPDFAGCASRRASAAALRAQRSAASGGPFRVGRVWSHEGHGEGSLGPATPALSG
jgi:hypothetical protein